MNIIDEMRREAGNAERSGHTYESLFMTEWADRLAASGALVPVTDGEAGMYGSVIGYHRFFTSGDFDGIWERHPPSGMLAVTRFDKPERRRFVDTLGIVQPVRLVAITEAEV